MNKASHFQALTDQGSGPLTRSVLLYGRNNWTDLNELRCEKATKNIAAKRLPPTDHSFQLHLLRSVYQLALWRQSLHAMIEIPGSVAYGHEGDPESQKYYPKLMSQTTTAPELLSNLVYSCALNKCDEQCTCAINEQPCTAACTCEASLPTGEDDDENVGGIAKMYMHFALTELLCLYNNNNNLPE